MSDPDPSWTHRETHRWNHTVDAYVDPKGGTHIRLRDNSGEGVWVDTSRPVDMSVGSVEVPVHDPQLANATTPTCVRTATYVLRTLKMDLRRKLNWKRSYTIPSSELLQEEALLAPRLSDEDVDSASAIRRWRALEKSSQSATALSAALPSSSPSLPRSRL